MLEVADALEQVLVRANPLAAVSVALGPEALGRVLAEAVAAEADSPPFARSVMDGYAVRSVDCTVGAMLAVVETITAGQIAAKSVAAGQAARIMTGAPVPAGTDAVVPQEFVEVVDARIRVRQPVPAGAFIVPKGKEMKAGETILAPGLGLSPPAIGMAAALGRTALAVRPAPRVSVISTGDELVEPGQEPGPGQLRNSNGPMLVAQIQRGGGRPHYAGLVRDDRTALRATLAAALDQSDVVVLSGGASVGDLDLVPDAIQHCGIEVHFHRVRMKPGKPLIFGSRGSKLVFGLPGNPVSSFVCFELFVRPAMRRLAGQAIAEPIFRSVPLASKLEAKNDRPTYAPARMEFTHGGTRVRPADWFGSGDLRALCESDALIRLPAGAVMMQPGQAVPTLTFER